MLRVPLLLLFLSICNIQVQAKLPFRQVDKPSSSSPRQLAYFEALAGYQPKSLIIDEAAIDLDQKTLEEITNKKSFSKARLVYTQGGHSDSYAVLQLRVKSTEASTALEAGQLVFGVGKDGSMVQGSVRTSLTTYPGTFSGKGKGSLLSVTYDIRSLQSSSVACQVGSLTSVGEADTSGCFSPSGSITFIGQTKPFGTYTYNITADNVNGRTLQGFSTNAAALMWNCSGRCPYDDFRKYVTYYGVPNYGDEFITSALKGVNTSFSNGNAEFGGGYNRGGRGEAVTGGSLLLNTWMMVIAEMEAAIDECVDFGTCPTCIFDSINHWDIAVAYYAGSKQGNDGSGKGFLLFQRANDLCQNFRTCGASGNRATGVSAVNVEIINEFERGQDALSQRQCDKARASKEKIVKLMTVPLIQGTLLNAYILEHQASFYDVEKAEIQGSTYAAAILPIIYNCSKDDADILYSYMGVGQNRNMSYVSVKKLFEKNYACMGISCGQVGGFWLPIGEYGVDAAPCDGGDLSKHQKLGIGLGTVAGFLFILVCVVVYIKYGRKRKSMQEPYSEPDIIMTEDLDAEKTPSDPPAIT